MTLTERSIQRGLMARFGSSFQCACPNFTPGRWWECDLWAVTKAGYVVEYEIKLSLADFTADRRKETTHRVRVEGRNEWRRQNKHDLLAAGDCVPSRFFFAVPESLFDAIRPKLPPFAGLVTCEPNQFGFSWCRLRVPAPKLHRRKVEEGQIAQAMKATYHRYWNAIRTIEDLQQAGRTASA